MKAPIQQSSRNRAVHHPTRFEQQHGPTPSWPWCCDLGGTIAAQGAWPGNPIARQT